MEGTENFDLRRLSLYTFLRNFSGNKSQSREQKVCVGSIGMGCNTLYFVDEIRRSEETRITIGDQGSGSHVNYQVVTRMIN